MLPGKQVGGCQDNSLATCAGGEGEGMRGHGGLARTNVPLEQPEHGLGAREIRSDGGHGVELVHRQADLPTNLLAEHRTKHRPHLEVAQVVHDHRRGPTAAALPASGHHAKLQREQLVEGEPSERVGHARRIVWVVRMLDGSLDPDEAFLGPDGPRQVLGIGAAGPIDRLANGQPQARRHEPAGQSVDGHDPAGMEEVPMAVLGLELWVVELDREPARSETAAQHQAVPGLDPSFDVAPAEPDGFGRAGTVLHARHRLLEAPAERLLHTDGGHRDPGADLLPIGNLVQRGNRAHLTPVVIAPRQVEQQIADDRDPQPRTDPAQGRSATEPAGPDRRGEQFDRVGRWGGRARGGWTGAPDARGSADSGRAHAIPQRSGTDSGAVRHREAPPRPWAGPSRSGGPAPVPPAARRPGRETG